MKRFAKGLPKLGLFMLLGVLTALVVVKIAVSREGVVVPDFRGTAVVAALEVAHQQGSGPQVTSRVFNTALPRNAILTQDPKTGSWLNRHGIVRVVVSTGSCEITVLEVQGLAWHDAKATLERGGARLGGILCTHSDRVPRERVMVQSLPPRRGPTRSAANVLGVLPQTSGLPLICRPMSWRLDARRADTASMSSQIYLQINPRVASSNGAIMESFP
jgi:hypothetical protein